MEKIKLFKTNIFGFKRKEVETYLSQLEASYRRETDELRDALEEQIQKKKALEAETQKLQADAAVLQDELLGARSAQQNTEAVLENVRADFEKLKYDYDTLKYVYDNLQPRYAALQSENEAVKSAIFRLPFVQEYILQLKEEIKSLRINQNRSETGFTEEDTDRAAKLNQCIDDIMKRIDAILAQT